MSNIISSIIICFLFSAFGIKEKYSKNKYINVFATFITTFIFLQFYDYFKMYGISLYLMAVFYLVIFISFLFIGVLNSNFIKSNKKDSGIKTISWSFEQSITNFLGGLIAYIILFAIF